ncbi:hypothetical protein HMPREF1326_00748 [Akkermansia sp. KLE1605]|nr:hypothetical protein HMPREF1326_00748 [Akkermansia sp. KLE1605]
MLVQRKFLPNCLVPEHCKSYKIISNKYEYFQLCISRSKNEFVLGKKIRNRQAFREKSRR